MDWLMHNPIGEMYGPHFLLLYGGVIAVTLLVCWWGVRSRDPTADLPALPVPEKPLVSYCYCIESDPCVIDSVR